MAYNNGFPMSYQPMQFYYPQQYQTQPQPQQQAQNPQPQQNNNSIIWVQGEAGAKSYLVAPNTTVQLWDSENQVIYLKSADASGMPSMKVLDYKIRDTAPPQNTAIPVQVNDRDFVTREELTAFEQKIREQIAEILAPKKGEKDE